MDDKTEFLELMKKSNFIVIVTHQSPDGDALGSVAALSSQIVMLGTKVVNLFLEAPFPKFDYLNIEWDKIVPDEFDLVIFLDCENAERTGNEELLAKLYSNEITVINIDHHLTNSFFGDVNIQRSVSSTCEILFDLFKQYHFPISEQIAVDLLTGIIEDTGNFRYPSTTSHCLFVASELINSGADLIKINNHLRKTFEMKDFLIWTNVFTSIQVSNDGRAVMATLLLSDFPENSLGIPASSDLLNLLLRLRTAEIVILFREMPEGIIGITLRSEEDIDSSQVAKKLGGGGHIRAAGARYSGSMSDAKNIVCNLLSKLYAIDF